MALKSIPSKWKSRCKGCNTSIAKGEKVFNIAKGEWVCGVCAGVGKQEKPVIAVKAAEEKPTITRTVQARFSTPCGECKAPFQIDADIHKFGKIWICDSCADDVNSANEDDGGIVPVVEKKPVVWSQYQIDSFNFVAKGTGHAVIRAVAGSGKTTTAIEALKHVPRDLVVYYLAFNRAIAKTLKERAPKHVKSSTIHSLGNRLVQSHFKIWTVNPVKVYKYLDTINSPNAVKTNKEKKLIRMTNYIASKLVSLAKGQLAEADQFPQLAEHFGLPLNGNEKQVFDLAKQALDFSRSPIDDYDYDDMVWLPVIHKLKPKKLADVLFIDETQDLNKAQVEFAIGILSNIGRIIAIGDPYQSIYGFRGADVEAMPRLIERLDAKELPLSVSYRCPKSVVRLAQTFVPHIESSDDAPEGEIRMIGDDEGWTAESTFGDMVLCRTNAPMVKPVFELIRRGVRAVINGKDFAEELKQMINKLSENDEETCEVFEGKLNEFYMTECARIKKKNPRASTSMLDDKVLTLVALSEGSPTVAGIRHNIDLIFAEVSVSDFSQWVTFSTVHKAKGLEADRVYIMEPSGMPSEMAESEWEIEQEKNIMYVAVTRAKKVLTFVGECNWSGV